MATLYTVGHGIRTLEELRAVLASASVERLVDVRRYPGSRRNPHLSRSSLEAAVPGYEWWGEALGGRRSRVAGSRHTAWTNDAFAGYADHMDSPPFLAALARLLDAATERPAAVMCAETLWWKCHRRLIADAATMAGMPVVHLLDAGHAEPHRLTEFARPDEEGHPVYDAGQPGLI